MALSSTITGATYTANGVLTSFAVTCVHQANTEIKVYVTDLEGDITLKTEGIDYTLDGSGSGDATLVTFSVAPTSGHKVRVQRETIKHQTLDYAGSDAINLLAFEAALDRIVAMVQEVDARVDRAILTDLNSGLEDLVFPPPSAGQVLAWNEDEDGLENLNVAELVAAALDTTGTLAAVNNLSDLDDVPTALENLGIDGWFTQTSHSLTSGQSATDLSGETVDATQYTSMTYEYEVRRLTNYARGKIHLVRTPSNTWALQDDGYVGNATHGVTFTVSEAGGVAQLRAAMNSGDGNGTLKFKKYGFAL